MSESKAEESYKLFTSLRDKFGGPPKPHTVQEDTHNQKLRKDRPHSAGKRRSTSYDPRANAPPLMPLVEEGDQVQQELYTVDERLQKLALPKVNSAFSPLKGKWKHNIHYKSNHLNGPDFEALETASVTSCSSAYSSKSESSTFSPFGPGSVTELSDVESYDTFLEYDIHSPKRHPQSSQSLKVQDLCGNFEQNKPDASFSEAPVDEVPEELVQYSTKAWNKTIGEWVFLGVPHSSPTHSRMRKPSNEIRVPTPLTTPLGSTENLLDSGGSRCSLLSSGSNYDDDSEDEPPTWHKGSYKLGKFVRNQSNRRLRPESNLLKRRISSSSLPEHTATADTTRLPVDIPLKDVPVVNDDQEKNDQLSSPPSNKWLEALSKYRTKPQRPSTDNSKQTNQTDNDRGNQESPHSAPRQTTQTVEEPAYSSVVAERAERFGGTRKQGLRRAQSFQIGASTNFSTSRKQTLY